MWSLNEFKHFFYAFGLIGVILCFAPTFVRVIDPQPHERFSELYVLGPGHMAKDYPFNVYNGNSNIVYLGVGDHMGSSMYYEVDVKLRNESELPSNSTTASSLPVLYQYNILLGDGQVWEDTLTFSFSEVVINGSVSCSVGKMLLNNEGVQLDKKVGWDNENNGFYYQLLVELWAYNQTIDRLLYDGRYASLWLNMTSTA